MIGTIAALALVAGAAVGSASSQQFSRTGEFELAIPVADAFPLFSPEGERVWAKGWDPAPLFPADAISFRQDTVFTLGRGGQHETWVITDLDLDHHSVQYVYVVPGIKTARIRVKLEALDTNRTRVNVTYVVTLQVPDQEVEREFSVDGFKHRMEHWKQVIDEYLASAKRL